MANTIQQNIADMPHCGKLIEQIMQEKRFTKSNVANGLHISPISINRYIEQHSLQTGIVWKVGKVLGVNMLDTIAKAHPIAVSTNNELLLQQRIADLEKELAIYKEIVARR
jgi:plasmid maintenance system antidote protein VapI